MIGHVFAVGGNFEKNHRIWLETKVILIGDLAALGVMKRQDRLEPSGNGVGDEGNEFASEGGNHDSLALARLEAIAVDFTRGDLSVHRAGRDAAFDLFLGSFAEGKLLLAEHLEGRGEHGFAGRLGQLSDVERRADW
jgi:hypothetical protein